MVTPHCLATSRCAKLSEGLYYYYVPLGATNCDGVHCEVFVEARVVEVSRCLLKALVEFTDDKLGKQEMPMPKSWPVLRVTRTSPVLLTTRTSTVLFK